MIYQQIKICFQIMKHKYKTGYIICTFSMPLLPWLSKIISIKNLGVIRV